MLYNFLKCILNGRSLLFTNIITNNRLFLIINNLLSDIKINGYLFINIIFIKKALKYLKVFIIIDFRF